MKPAAVCVEPVVSRSDTRRFLHLPWRLYAGDPCWIPPLRSQIAGLLDRRHPFYEAGGGDRQLFLAWRAGRPVGRLAAILNRSHNRFHGDRSGFFGFFECDDDPAAARALVEAAAEWLRDLGCDRLIGPVNPSTNYECGLLVDGFDIPPAVMMPYNPSRYADLLEGAGLRKARDLLAFRSEVHDGSLLRLKRLADRVRAREGDLETRSVDLGNLARDVELVRFVYNRAWERNWGFVPASAGEFSYLAREIKGVVDPSLLRIALRGGSPVGFLLALPDINPALAVLNGTLTNPWRLLKAALVGRRRLGLRVLTMGVIPEARMRGVEALLVYESLQAALDRGYRWCEYSWILEDNELVKGTIRLMATQESQRYRLYEMDV